MSDSVKQRGVTLPELLIALLIFAAISSVGVYALRLSIDGRGQLERVDKELRDWQLARLIIREDLTQIALRIVRDEFGAPQAAPFIGGLGFSGRVLEPEEEPLLAFVRRGWSNYDAASPRSSLQYVEYVLKGNDLVRRVRPYLDDARNQPDTDRILFRDVSDIEMSFFLGEDSRGPQWSSDWPVPGRATSPPRALRVSFLSQRFSEMEQLFWIGKVAGQDEGGEE